MRELLGADADPRRQRQHGAAGENELPYESAMHELQGDGDRDRGVEEPTGDALHVGGNSIASVWTRYRVSGDGCRVSAGVMNESNRLLESVTAVPCLDSHRHPTPDSRHPRSTQINSPQ